MPQITLKNEIGSSSDLYTTKPGKTDSELTVTHIKVFDPNWMLGGPSKCAHNEVLGLSMRLLVSTEWAC